MVRCVMQRCCCLNVKDGLETFGYIKIIQVDNARYLSMMVFVTQVFSEMISYTTLLYLTGGFYAQYQNTGEIEVPLTILLNLCCFSVDFMMTVLHLYSLRKDNLPLIFMYLYYVILTLVTMIVGLPFFFYYVVLSPEPTRALFNVWVLVGTAVLAWIAIGLHILLAFGVYSYGVLLTKLRKQALQAKAEAEMRRVSV